MNILILITVAVILALLGGIFWIQGSAIIKVLEQGDLLNKHVDIYVYGGRAYRYNRYNNSLSFNGGPDLVFLDYLNIMLDK